MQLHGKHIISGQPAPATETAPSFFAVNPADGAELQPAYREATHDEVNRAVREAADAQDSVAALSPELRGRLLREIAVGIEALGDTLIQRCMAETALPEARLTGERTRTVNQLRMFAALVEEGSWVEARIDRSQPNRKPAPKPDLRRMLMPLGPVAVFGASNFPLAFSVAGGDTASAIAAGNPVILKAHPCHPGTSELVGEVVTGAVKQLGLPPAILSMLHGAGHEVRKALVSHPSLQAVGFTGSERGGRALYNIAASRPAPIPVFAEMGSINPVFVLPGALRTHSNELVSGLTHSATLSVGQFCTQPGVVFVCDCPERERWLEEAGTAIKSQSCGVMLSAGIASAYAEAVSQIENTPGVEPTGAEPVPRERSEKRSTPPNESTAPAAGTVVCPQTFAADLETYLAAPALQNEAFGPVTVFVRVNSEAELLRAAESLEGQLTATIHADSDELTQHAALRAALTRTAGRIIYNGYPTGVEVCPSMHHGGPYPAATFPQFTSIGTAAVLRFARPVCFQNMPAEALPPELQDENPRGILRLVDGTPTREALSQID